MKLKKIMLVSILLLAILTIGAVSAEDNVTSDKLAIEEISSDEISIEQNDYVSKDYNTSIDVTIPDKIITNGKEYFDEEMSIDLPVDVDEYNMNVYFDDKVYRTFDSEYSIFQYIDLDDEFYEFIGNPGYHEWKVEFLGDGKYNPMTLGGKFFYSQIDIDFSEETDSDYVPIDIYAPKGANGYVTVNINGKQVTRQKFKDKDWDDDYAWMSLNVYTGIKEKQFGLYPYIISYTGDNKLYDFVKNGTFNYHYTFDVYCDEEIDIGRSTDLCIDLPEDVKGKVDITIDGVTETVVAEEIIRKEIEGLDLFNHTIVVRYYGGNYPENSTTLNLYVREYWDIESYVDYKHNVIVNLTMNKNAKGKLVVKLDDKVIASANFVDGVASAKLPILPLGEHYIICEYQGSDYKIEPKEEYVQVTPVVTIPDMRVGDNKYLEIEYPSDATGDLEVLIDYEECDVEFKNGKARVSLAYLDVGLWDVEIIYENGNYPDYGDDFEIDVKKLLPKITPTFPNTLTVGEKAKFTFTLPKDATGEMQIIILVDGMYGEDWDDGYGDINSGKATVYVTPTKAGTWSLNYLYDGDDKYDMVSEAVMVTVSPAIKKITGNTNVNMYYYDGHTYKVRVRGDDGQFVGKNQIVLIKVGKTLFRVKTNANGWAILKIPYTITPGKYIITTAYAGQTVKNVLNVIQVLKTPKTATVKKSAKILLLKAVLKKGKVPIAGKIVKFKVNGKIYSAKTNKNGLAIAKINKAAINKLSIRKYIVQTIYLKDIVKSTLIVRR
ncbi:Ig-like domain-containing protein [uncultured Methanobrevibacter sp.]|uniref:Ig-like domain-containing protein n=1 Tax=uncultured Methanobrevibacter sp. TaxID=253161 RepID=UPI0025F64051|nr:Ig-like domain-containing protein [uncultured Methanobrevibacter sp.]